MTTCRSSCHQYTNHDCCHHLPYVDDHRRRRRYRRCHPDQKENSLGNINSPTFAHHQHLVVNMPIITITIAIATVITIVAIIMIRSAQSSTKLSTSVQHMGTSAKATATIRRSCQNDEGVCEVTRRDCSTNLLVIWRSFNATTTQRIDPQC